MSTDLQLIIEDDEGRTTVYPVADGAISIGRKEGNTVQLYERNVSRRHARLFKESDRVLVEDLDSYNGVRINGERIDGRFPVQAGDLIEIGDYHLALRWKQEAAVGRAMSSLPTMTETPPPNSQTGTVPDFELPPSLRKKGPPSQDHLSTIVDEPSPFPSKGPPENGDSSNLISDLEQSLNPPEPVPSQEPDFAQTALRSNSLQRLSSIPRLVCVSTEHAGRSFDLTGTEDIIGRTEENSIVVEHRSVSRNHAKLQFDGRTHKIIDLQSANGILVNGEEYAMTNLRSGDLIELGHVRFRYIPGNETFVPTDEESTEIRSQGIEPPPGRVKDDGPTPRTADPSLVSTLSDADPPEADLEALRKTMVEKPRSVAPRLTSAVQGDTLPTQPKPLRSTPPPAWAGPQLSYRALMGGLIALLSVLVLVLIFFLSSKRDPMHDQRLEALFNQKDYTGVKQYFDAHEKEFSDKNRAHRILGQAEAMERVVRDAAPSPTLETQSELSLKDLEAPTPRRSPRAIRSARASVRQSEKRLLAGDLSAAYRLMEGCLRRFPNAPECHRQMGRTQGMRQKPEEAIRHYERFLQLRPEASDAAELRELIEALGQARSR